MAALFQPGIAAEKRPVLGRTVKEFEAKDTLGTEWTAESFAQSKVLVIAVLGTECPLAQLYAPRLQALADDYADKGVAFVGIAPNRQDSIAELTAYVRRQELKFPLLKDLNNVIADALGAERTPEVFVLDAHRVVRYHGRVDDQYAVGGRNKPAPTQQELKNAIDDLLADRAVALPSTPAMGCLIGRVRTPVADASVTYTGHVAKILNERCVECHRPGEIGPFSLTEYDEVVGWADMIAEVTRERRMPPWHADPQFGHFINERRLTDDELATIQAWVKAGAPEGDPQAKPSLPTFTTGWQLPKEPDMVVAMRDKPFSVPATGEVRYQYFMADPQLTEDKWVIGAEVIPGNRSVVHHVIVFAASKDGKVKDEDRQFLCAYVPGLRIGTYPKGMAKKLPAGSKLIFQVHYTPIGTEKEDLTKVGLLFGNDDEITHEVQTVSTMSRNFKIEPFKADQKFWTRPLTTPADVLMLSMSPHMHLRGQSFRYEMTWPNGQTETLLNVPHYDFNWQTAYALSEPMIVPAGSKLAAYASFDNSSRNLANPDPSATVKWGDQSWEEMLIGYCDIAIERGVTSGKTPANTPREEVVKAVAGPLFRRLDRNSDGKLERDEVEERLRESFDKVDTDKDGIVTPAELEVGLPKLRRN
ncbi:MAG TPA: redoxin domain-containing protein [Planctomycetaceae bacterium]|nr:redoxin domain-containing protein [Planctomycetaceae bacterium]